MTIVRNRRRFVPTRDSGGFTLMEVLLTVAILAAVMVPIMLWAASAVQRTNDTVSADSVSFTQLNQYLKRDVPSATEVIFGLGAREPSSYDTCADLVGSAPTGDPVLILAGTQGADPIQIEYVTVTDADGTATMQRQVCTQSSGAWTVTTQPADVATGLVDRGSGFAEVTCKVRDDDPAQDACGVVTVGVQADGAKPVELSQVRRTDGQPIAGTSDLKPIARITSDPNPAAGSRPFTVRFDGSTSEDPANPAVQPPNLIYDWSVTPTAGASCTANGTSFTCTFVPIFDNADDPSSIYVVRLVVENGAQERSRAARKNVEVRNSRPTAAIGISSEPVYRNVSTQFFSNSADVDGPDGKPVEWSWDFDGDGEVDVEGQENPDYTYPVDFLADGQLSRDVTVTLTVRDSDGQTTTVDRVVTVRNAPPLVAITPADATLPDYPGNLEFSANPVSPCVPPDQGVDPSGSCDLDGEIVSYEWDFGDNTAPVSGPGPVTHRFSGVDNLGNPVRTYTVSLTATDDSGETSTVRSLVTINRKPTAVIASAGAATPGTTFGQSANSIVVNGPLVAGVTNPPVTVDFDALSPSGTQSTCPDPLPSPPTTSCDPDNSITSFSWKWADQPTATTGPASTTSRTFTAAGTYTLTLTVTDADGGTATATKTVKVNRPPAASQSTPNQPLSGPGITYPAASAAGTGQVWRKLPVTFTSNSTDNDAGLLPQISACNWTVLQGATVLTTATGCSLTWTPNVLGTVTVRLDVVDSQGGQGRFDRVVTVRNRPPIVNPSAVQPTKLVGTKFVTADGVPMQAGCNQSIDPDADDPTGGPLTCTWTWGDGTPNTAVSRTTNVSHLYPTLASSCVGASPNLQACGTYNGLQLAVSDGVDTTTWAGSAKVNRPPTVSVTFVSPTNGRLNNPNYPTANPDRFRFVVQASMTDVDGFPKGLTYLCEQRADASSPWIEVSRSTQHVNNPPVGVNLTNWNATQGYPALPQGVCDYTDRGEKRVRVEAFDNDETYVTSGSEGVVGLVNLKPIAKLRFTSPLTVDPSGQPVVFPSPPTNPGNSPVSFIDDGSFDPDDPAANGTNMVHQWTWDQGVTTSFGTGPGPYTQAGFNVFGVRTLTLRVQDANATWSDPVSIQIRVNRPPSADFAKVSPSNNCTVMLNANGTPNPNPASVCRGVPVTFDASDTSLRPSSDLDSPVVAGSRIGAYEWVIDGVTYTTPTVTLTFATTGVKLTSLRVADTDGVWTSVLTRNTTVVDAPPKGILTVNPDPPFTVFQTGTTLPVIFDGSASFDPDTTPGDSTTLRYSWNFGDGTTVAEGAPGVNRVISHTYSTPGKHTATMTVRDASGTTTVVTRDVVLNIPPVAGITAVPIGNNSTLTFDGSPSTDPNPDGDTAALTYSWNFGDPGSGAANTATGRNPSHTFSARGSYVVTLVVTDKYGTASSPFQTTVQVNQKPTAVIAPPPAIVLNTPYQYTFVGNGSTDDEGAANLTYSWNFGDGTPLSAQADPTHTFTAPTVNTTRTVTLTVTDRFGETSSATISVKLNRAPTAVIGPDPLTGERGFPKQLDGGGSTDPDGDSNALTYSWNFGDPASGAANTGTGRTPTHTYTANGTYTVTLTVTDADGGISTPVTKQIVVDDRAPVASFTTSPGGDPVYELKTPGDYLDLTVDASASVDPYGNGLQYQWDWGDGAAIVPFGPNVTTGHSYTATGRFTLTLTVRDPVTTKTATATRTVVFNAPPISVITPSDTYRSSAPATVNFSGAGSSDPNPDGGPLTYAWDFGDPTSGSNTSAVVAPSHVYSTPGAYVVTLTVTDKYGATATSQATVRVNTKPTAVISGPATIVLNPNYTNTFDGRSSTDDAGAANLTYLWDFGDGNTSTSNNPSHTYSATLAGTTRTVTLTVTDQFGETGTATQQVKINQAPTAVIGPDPIRAKVGFTTQFDGNGSTDPDGSAANLTYVWSFGDPASGAANTSTSSFPVHLYTSVGTYTVSLTVTDQDGLASATVTKDVQVTVNQAPTAAIAPIPPPVYRNVPVTLDGSPSTDPDGVLTNWTWTLPGGGTRTGQTTSYAFPTEGPATISLVVRDDNGVFSAPASVTVNVVKKDLDGDGYEDGGSGGDDCDDTRADVHPGAPDALDAAREDTNCDNYDGVVGETIFVRVNGSLASGAPAAGGCGAPLDPCGSLDDAIIKAQALGRPVVQVASGTYARTTITGAGVVVRGGYSQNFDRRGTTNTAARLTRINGSNAFDGVSSAVRVAFIDAPVELRDLTIAGADATGAGQASYALIVDQAGTLLTVRDSIIIGGRGGTGANGIAGASASQTPPTAGSPGQNSLKWSTECNEARRSGGAGGSGVAGGGGGGGQIDTKCSFVPNYDATGGVSGGNGNPTGPSSCGLGNSGGGAGGDGDGGAGSPGRNGCAGAAGGNGGGGAGSTGTLAGGVWVPAAGANGGNGSTGSAGGGGGGGGGATDNSCETRSWFFNICENGNDSMGAGGGGGGAGGAAALTAGTGGRAGGASISVLLLSSNPTFSNVQVQIGTGGTGGRGGNGGNGQPGGAGGAGGFGRCNNGAPTTGPCTQVTQGAGGGAGGAGGAGGLGGASGAGGGGAGGPAIGVVRSGAADPSGLTITGGTAGAGGQSGTPGNGGSAGSAGGAGSVTQRIQLP